MFDYETVKGWAESVIAEKGDDFVYEAPDKGTNCVYAVKSEEGLAPSCLIGVMLYRKGLLDLDKVYNPDKHYNGQRILPLLSEFTYDRYDAPTCSPELFTGKAKTFMSRLQEGQDSKKTWRASLRNAMEDCENYNEEGNWINW